MKKILAIGAIFAGAVLLTGCGGSGNTYTCSAKYTEGGESMTQKVVAHLDNNKKVKSYDLVYEMSTEDSAETVYSWYSSLEGYDVSKNGKTVTIKNAQDIADSEIELVGKTKDEVKKLLSETEPNIECK